MTPAATPPPLRADAARNRERIMSAARAVFAEHGLDVGMAEIAQLAGVGNATLFRRFPTKHDLVVAVVEESVSDMRDLALEALEREDHGAAFDDVFLQLCDAHARDLGLVEATAQQFQGEPRLVELRDEILASLAEVTRRAQAAGALRTDLDPIDVPVLSAAVAYATHALGEPGGDVHRRYAALALAGMRPGADLPPLAPSPPTIEQIEAAKQARGRKLGC